MQRNGWSVCSGMSGHNAAEYALMLVNKSYKSINSYIIYFRKVPTIMSSGGIFPEFDFDGNQLQKLAELDDGAEAIFFTLMAIESGGIMVFTWLSEHSNCCDKFIKSLDCINDQDISNSLVRFVFESCENTFVSPIWWDSLPDYMKGKLIDRMFSGGSLYRKREPDYLSNDHLKYDNWDVEKRVLV